MTESEISPHQINLLLGKIKPASNEEWEYIQAHANDVILEDPNQPKPTVPPMPPGIDELPPAGVKPGILTRDRPTTFVPPTFVAKTAEALEEKGK